MADFVEEQTDFAGGVQAAVPGTEIPLNAMRHTMNTAFYFLNGQVASLGKRPGLVIVNSSAISGSPNIHWAKRYVYATKSGAVQDQIALITNAGELYYKNSDETISTEVTKVAAWGTDQPNCFNTNPTAKVDGTTIGDRLLLVNSAGDRITLQDGDYHPFGLAVSDLVTISSVTAVDTGSGLMPDGDYTVYLTVYNPATGDESNRDGPYTVTLSGSQNIRIQGSYTTFTDSGPGGEYKLRVYVQRDETQATAYKALPVYNSGQLVPGDEIDGEVSLDHPTVPSVDCKVRLTAAQLSNLLIPMPYSGENNKLPVTAKYLATFGQRIIAADQRNIYWSKLNGPGMFPEENTEPIDTGDGSPIIALAAHSDDILLILTSTSVFGLFGNDPQSWVLKPITRSCGCVGHQSICTTSPLGTTWWAPELGPVAFDGAQVHFLMRDRLGVLGNIVQVNTSYLTGIVSDYDPSNYRLMWAYPETGQTKNTAILPFNTRMMQFEASRWTTMRIGALVAGQGNNNARFYLCGAEGQVFYFDQATKNDGAPSGTVTGTVTGVTSISNITSTGFYTTGTGLQYRRLTLVKSNGTPVSGYETSRIITNATSTTLTLESPISGLSASETYTWYVAPINVLVYTRWFGLGMPFLRKRIDTVFVGIENTAVAEDWTTGTVVLDNNFIDSDPVQKSSSGGAWPRRFRMILSGLYHRVELHFPATNDGMLLNKISLAGRTLSDRIQY